MKDADGKGDGDAHPHADLTDQIDFGGHLAGQLLLIGAALGLQEVVVEADLLTVFRRDGYAEGGDHTRLTHKLHVDAKEDDAVEGVPVLQQGHAEQILILHLRIDQLLHGIHQRVGRFLVIVALDCRSVSPDDLLQRVLRLVEDIHIIAGSHLELQTYGGLGVEQHGHIQPQESAVHVDLQGQLFLKVQIGRERDHQALGTVQGNRNSHTDAGSGGAVLDGHLDVQLGVADIGHQGGQRIGVRAVLFIQHPLGILAGHNRHQHLGLQLVVGGQLAGDGLLDLGNLLLGQVLLQVHILGGMHIHLGDVGLGIRVDEGHLAGAVGKGLHRLNLGEQHIARQIAALPGIDGGFLPADIAVVEHDHLLRLQIDLAGHDQLAGNHIALGIVILNHVMYGAVLGIVACVLNPRIDHGGIAGYVVPQNVGQSLGKLNDLDLLTEDAYRQRIDILGITGKAHIVLHIQGKGAAGSEARLAVELRAAFGFAHGDFGSLQAGTDFHGDVLFRVSRTHALGQHQSDGCRAVGKLNFGNRAGILPHLLLIGRIHGIEGHAPLNGIGIAEARGAFLVHAPAAEGIAFLEGIKGLHRLGQQILTLGKHHGLDLTAAEGFKGDNRRLGFVDEPGIQGHLPVHGAQTGNGGGILGILIPGGENLTLQGGDGLAKIHHAAGGNFLDLNRRALGDEVHQPLAQDKVHLLAGLQLHDLGIGARHLESFVRFIDHRTGGADGQGVHSLLHTNHTQGAVALDHHFVGALDNHLGKLRAGIHVEVDRVGLILSLRVHRGIPDVYTGNLAFAQINAGPGIQGQGSGLHGGQSQVLRRRDSQTVRQHGAHGKIVAQNGDVARLRNALQGVDGRLGIHRGGERDFHQMHILVGADGGFGINLRRFPGQIAILRQDGKINAVILQAQVLDALRMRGQINVGRVLHNKAQHPGNLFAGLLPGELPHKGKHFPRGGFLGRVPIFRAAREIGGDQGNHQDH